MSENEDVVRLAPHIGEAVQKQAEMLGLSPEEILKMIVGNWAQQFRPPPMPLMSGGQIIRAGGPVDPSQGKVGILGIEMRDVVIAARISRYIWQRQMKAGEFKCTDCTFALNEEAFFQGKCENCGASVMEEEKPGGKETDD